MPLTGPDTSPADIEERCARLLLVARSLDRGGGIEAHVRESARVMASAGYEVCVVVADPPSGGGEEGFEVASVAGLDRPRISPDSRRNLESLASRFAPGIVHIHQVADPTAVGDLQRMAPLVWSVHNYDPVCMGTQKYFAPGDECMKPHGPGCMANILLRGCDHRRVPRPSPKRYAETGRLLRAVRHANVSVGYSRFVCDQLERNAVESVGLIPLFTDPPDAYRSPPRRGRVLFVGRVVPQKGLEVLLEAVALTPNVTLDVCGDGWGMDRVRATGRSLGVLDRVRFHGWQSEARVSDFYDESDVVAVPSIWPEPFGLVGIDAMRHGRAVIASDTGGIRDWLTEGVTGRLVPPGDAHALGRSLASAMAHPLGTEEMGRQGAVVVAERFSPKAFVAATLEYYGVAQTRWTNSRAEPG
jgi:glycosyltransferase involved in cell wall biosynthesis